MMPFALPPAETRLTGRSLVRGFLGRQHDFAQKLSLFLGVPACALADSARSLLYLLLRHLRTRSAIKNGHILLPGYTCYSVPAAVVKSGFRVALYDIHPHTLQPDMDDVQRKINSETIAVVGQHLLGIPGDVASLTRLAHSRGVYSIEDSAQLLRKDSFSTHRNMCADFTLFSFGRGKPLPLGSGGALVARNKKFLHEIASDLGKMRIRRRNYWLPLAIKALANPRIYPILEKMPIGLGLTVFDPDFSVHPMPGLFQKLGACALPELEGLNSHRQKITRVYNKLFHREKLSHPTWNEAALLRYPLLVQQQGLSAKLYQLGVRKLYPQALGDINELQAYLLSSGEKPRHSIEIARKMITLPTHTGITKHIAEKIGYVICKNFPD